MASQVLSTLATLARDRRSRKAAGGSTGTGSVPANGLGTTTSSSSP